MLTNLFKFVNMSIMSRGERPIQNYDYKNNYQACKCTLEKGAIGQ